MKVHAFVEMVARLEFANCFNPYTDRCIVHDRKDAPIRRREALSELVNRACVVEVDALWVGRDLGYRGGRRTGLALTDDVHIGEHCSRWNISMSRPTSGVAVAERTAAVIWDVLNQIDKNIFLWNVFPLHPHEPNEPFSNRQHNSKERRAGEELLAVICDLIQPRRIVAIGNDAANACQKIYRDKPVYTVRHPSYGGQSQFLRQVSELYGLGATSRQGAFDLMI